MTADLLARARAWADEDPDAGDRAEIEALIEAGNTEQLERRFAGPLTFGTAGLRGPLRAGPACSAWCWPAATTPPDTRRGPRHDGGVHPGRPGAQRAPQPRRPEGQRTGEPALQLLGVPGLDQRLDLGAVT
ncbi:MAG: putative phosphomannomutase, partial [Modestobacter sp.]|nr:putative phosphomannomutase [Modestobacter sp.]